MSTTFNAFSTKGEEYSNDKTKIVHDLANIIRSEAPNAAFLLLVDKKKFPKPLKQACPPSLLTLAKEIDTSVGSEREHISALVEKLADLTDDDLHAIEETTRKQAASKDWKDQRAGRITASNMKRVATRAQSLQLDNSQDASALIKSLMGYNEVPLKNAAIKHGQSMEPHAKQLYSRLMKKAHKAFSSRDSGLVVHKVNRFIAASPDLTIDCKCCGKGICEIKCPYVCRAQKPAANNWSHLRENNGITELLPSSQYMYQMQGQMACSEVTYGDFFVYTSHGYHLQRVSFDEVMWADVCQQLEYFWLTYLAPETLTGSLQPLPETSEDLDHGYAASTSTISAVPAASLGSTKKTILTKSKLPHLHLCGICGIDTQTNTDSFESIKCGSCNMWMHRECLNMDAKDISDGQWCCSYCK